MLQSWEPWPTVFVGSIGLISTLLGITGLGRLKERPASRLQQILAGIALLGAVPMLLYSSFPGRDNALIYVAGWAGALVAICCSFIAAYAGVIAILSAGPHGGLNIISYTPHWLSGFVQREAQTNAAERAQAQARREARRQARTARRQA